MIDENKLLKMFHIVHGEMKDSFRTEVVNDYDADECKGVALYKDESFCWFDTTAEIVFSYLTRDWEE